MGHALRARIDLRARRLREERPGALMVSPALRWVLVSVALLTASAGVWGLLVTWQGYASVVQMLEGGASDYIPRTWDLGSCERGARLLLAPRVVERAGSKRGGRRVGACRGPLSCAHERMAQERGPRRLVHHGHAGRAGSARASEQPAARACGGVLRPRCSYAVSGGSGRTVAGAARGAVRSRLGRLHAVPAPKPCRGSDLVDPASPGACAAALGRGRVCVRVAQRLLRCRARVSRPGAGSKLDMGDAVTT